MKPAQAIKKDRTILVDVFFSSCICLSYLMAFDSIYFLGDNSLWDRDGD